MFDGLGTGLELILTPETLVIILLGTMIGFSVAILPGLSGVTAMALLLPVSFSMEPFQAMAFLVSIMGASTFGGSITAILLNVPGDAMNAATTLDGYPLSRQGKAGQAIGASATASALGALFGVIILVLSLPVIRQVILAFGPPEMFALALAGIAMIATVSQGNSLRGLIAGLAGMALGFIGFNLTLGGSRFTFDSTILYDGIPLLPAVIGIFAIPEIYNLLRADRPISRSGLLVKGGVLQGVTAVLKRPLLLLQSSAIGTAIGILPGVGAYVSSWIAYFAARNTSKEPERFGKGAIEGVIAPEASTDSKDGGALMPLLALGIPGGLSTAVLLSAFLMHSITPGQQMFNNDMSLVWVMIVALLLANFATSLIGLASSNLLVRITLIPASIIAPVVLSLAMMGGYSDVLNFWGVMATLGFGLIGILMVKADIPRPPFLVGFILLPIVERNLHQSLQTHRGSYEFLLRPITLTVIILIVLVMVVPPLLMRWRNRRKATALISVPAGGPGEDGPNGIATELPKNEPAAPGLLPSLLFLGLTLAMAVLFLVTLTDYDESERLLPLIVLLPLAALVLQQLTVVGLRWWRSRTEQAEAAAQETEEDTPAHSEWQVLAALALLPLLMWLIGMVPAIALYVLVVRLFFARPLTLRRAVEGLVAGLITAGLVHLLFVSFLDLRMVSGVLL